MYERQASEFEQEDSPWEAPFCTSEQITQRLQEAGVWSERTRLAMQQAYDSHSDKYRDSGRTYLEEHVFPVTLDVLEDFRRRGKPLSEQEVGVVASLLHDTIEDDPTFSILDCEQKFGRDVSRLVYPLTKYEHAPIGGTPKPLAQDIYFHKLLNASTNAQRIKLFDRRNNLTCSIVIAPKRLDKLSRYVNETAAYYLPLADLLLDKSLYNDLQELVKVGYATLEKYGSV
jgi:(p)ppGpp synthase/HD superfamily hydrolase